MIYYHITRKINVKKILKEGLIPKIGARSKKLKEPKGVFLFTSLSDAENAVMNWLGDEFGEDTALSCLKITSTQSFPIDPQIPCHAISTEAISPHGISVEQWDF